jgi:hypothetical protein
MARRKRIHIEPSDVRIGVYGGLFHDGRSCFVERVNDQDSVERCFELEDILRYGDYHFFCDVNDYDELGFLAVNIENCDLTDDELCEILANEINNILDR